MEDVLLRVKVIGSGELENVQKQLRTVTSFVEKYNRVIQEYEYAQKAGVQATEAQTKAYEKAKQMLPSLTSEQAKLTTTVENNSKAILSNNVATQSLAQQKRLEAKATTTQVGAYQQLLAELQLADNALLDMAASGVTAGAEFDAMKTKAAGLRDKVQSLHTTTGTMGKGMNNAYNSTFQLTQVMRELPNFAIDARIGFMSLSNNLPMLADGFNNLAKSVDATGKVLGKTGAFKVMAKSLLSMNTIMIAGITLMTLYGDDLVKAIGKIFKGSKDLDETAKNVGYLNKMIKDSGGSAKSSIEEILKLGVVLKEAGEGTYDSAEAVSLYNKTLGDTTGKVDDLSAATEGYNKYSKQYVKSMIANAAATMVMSDAAELYLKRERLAEQMRGIKNINELSSAYDDLVKIAKQSPTGMAELYKLLKKPDFGDVFVSTTGTVTKTTKELTSLEKAVQKIASMPFGGKFIKLMADYSKQTSDLGKKQDEAGRLLDEYSKILGNNEDVASKSSKATTKQAESYNHLAGALKTVQEARLELASNEETLGVRNPYLLRIEAANEWLEEEKRIIEEGKRLALESGEDSLKVTDDYNARIADAENKKGELLFKINNDYAKRKLENDADALESLKVTLEEEQAELINAENKRYQTVLQGAKNNKQREVLQREHKIRLLKIETTYNELILQSEIDSLKKSLDTVGLTSLEKEAIQREINKKELDLKRKQNDNVAKLEEAGAQESVSKFKIGEDAKREILEASLNTLSQALDAYYNYAASKTEKNLDNQIKSLNEQEEAAIESLDRQKEYGLLSDSSYNKRKEAIQKAYDKKEEIAKKKAFEADKKLKVKQAAMEYAMGVIRIWATHPEPITAGILTGLLTAATAINVMAIKAQKYALGGKIKTSNIPMQSNGDNVLATVKTGEVVLNEKQQQALGGDATFKAIGVPGFASGGQVIKPYTSSAIPPSSTQRITSALLGTGDIINLIKAQTEESVRIISEIVDNKINMLKVYVVESDITKAQNTVNVIVEQSKLL